MQRIQPGCAGRLSVEHRLTGGDIHRLAVEAKAPAQQGISIFQPARQRVMGMEGEMIGELTLEQAAINQLRRQPQRKGNTSAARLRRSSPATGSAERCPPRQPRSAAILAAYCFGPP